MGDRRYSAYYDQVKRSARPVDAIRGLTGEGVISALAAASQEQDRYLANVLATEAMNRVQRARVVTNSIGEGVFALDADGRVMFVNPAALEILGLRREEIIGEDMHTLVWHGDGACAPLSRERCRVLRVVETGETVTYEGDTFRRSDGSAFVVGYTASPIVRDRVVEGVVVVFHDVTARLAAEAALREQRDLTKAITDNAASALFMMDERGYPVFMNPAACEMTGYSGVEEIRDKPLHDSVHFLKPDGAPYPMSECPIDRANAEIRPLKDQHEVFTRKDGTRFPVKYNVAPIVRDGKRRGAVIEVRDVSADLAAEAALGESDARFRLVARATRDIVWDWDVAKGEVWRSAEAREGEAGGAPEGSLAFETWVSRIHPDDRARVVASLQAFVDGRDDSWRAEYRVRRADDSFASVLDRGYARRDASGRATRVVGSVQDVSRLKAAEEEARDRARQQAAVAALGQRALEGVSLPDLMNEAVRRVSETIHVPLAKVLELLPSGRELRLVAGVGWREGLVGGGRVGAGIDSQAGYTLVSEEPVIVDDLRSETRFSGPPLLHDHGVVSGMSVIIHGEGGAPYGVLGAHTTAHRVFSPDDVNFLRSVANVLAAAIGRERTEARLRASEAGFRALIEQAPASIHVCDPEGRTLLASERWETVWGTGRVALEGYNVLKDPQLARAGVLDELRRAFAGECVTIPPIRYDPAASGHPGRARWVGATAYPVRNEDGGVRAVVVVHEDVTDVRHIEDAHAFLAKASGALAGSIEYEETLANLARLAVPEVADLVVVKLAEPEGRLRTVALVDRDPAREALVRDLDERYPLPADAPHGPPRVMRTGETELVEEATDEMIAAVARNDDHHRALRSLGLRSSISVPLVARDRTLGVLTLALGESGRRYARADVSLFEEIARRAAVAIDNARLHRETEEARALLDTLFENAPVGFAVLDTSLRHLRLNERLADMNGIPAAEAIGRTTREVLPDLVDLVEPIERRVLETGEPVTDVELERGAKTASGSARHWLASYYPLRAGGGPRVTGVGVVMVDVTDQKRAAEETRRFNETLEARIRERTADLAAVNQELEAFSYRVSHDLRAPLRGIDFYTGVLEEDHGARLDPEARGHLARVRAESQRLTALVNDILALSRVTREDLRRERVDVSALAREVAAGIERARSGPPVDFRCAPGVVAHADPRLLRQVLENLLGNAWKFSAKVDGPRIEFACEREGDEVVYRVRDNGAGFDPEEAPKLFKAFQRLQSAKDFEGTGVGLATVKRIVERHGGRVWAEGAPGKGATFYFTLGAPSS